jgi:hypothetical protein
MKEHDINKLDNFIMGWYQDDVSILDEILLFFHSSEKKLGQVFNKDGNLQVEKSVKNSVDCQLTNKNELFFKYARGFLQPCTNEYIKKYPMCNMQSPWSIISDLNIQFYPPTGGFYQWHTERFSGQSPVSATHLVFMTYLNDVHEGGETAFYHQNLQIKPKKGLTLIWPSDWTFTHKGLPSQAEEKYIITGWYHFTA